MGKVSPPGGWRNYLEEAGKIKASSIEDLINIDFNGWSGKEIESVLQNEFNSNSFSVYYNSLHFIKSSNGDIHTYKTILGESDTFAYPMFAFTIKDIYGEESESNFKNANVYKVDSNQTLINYYVFFEKLNTIQNFIKKAFEDDFIVYVANISELFATDNGFEIRLSLIMKDGFDMEEYIEMPKQPEKKQSRIGKFVDFLVEPRTGIGRHDTGPR